MSRKPSRGTRLVAAFAVLGVVTALAAGLRSASASTNGQHDDNRRDASQNSGAQHHGNGPKANDFIDIRNVRPNVTGPRTGRNGSTGTFVADCGNNSNHHNNPGNFIVAPGVDNGAHHTHDYVGNTTTNGFSTDGSLAKGGTTCQNTADRSAYYWPVLRDLTRAGNDANRAGGGLDQNVGKILTPANVTIEFRGNPTSDVVAMPNGLKIVTGDAKAVTNGPKNANAKWTCTGFENRTTTKYPLCPRGNRLERILDFPSCWDGKNTDSTDHRTHVVFPDRDGSCPARFKPIAQLRYTLTYNQPAGRDFALDTFPEDNHVALTDHGDFEAVMSRQLRNDIAACINSGRTCTNTEGSD